MGLALVLPYEIQAGALISLGQCKEPKTIASCLWDRLVWKCWYYTDIFRISAEKGLCGLQASLRFLTGSSFIGGFLASCNGFCL